MGDLSADIIIIGSGAGGGTMAYALQDSGADVLILERGEFLPVEAENWSPEDTITLGRYKPDDHWEHRGRKYTGLDRYFVGGKTKFFGGCLARMRPADFDEYGLDDGPSAPWPVSYDQLEPYYTEAERIWGVRGNGGEDPMEPPRTAPYAFPGIPHDPEIAGLADRLRAQGLHPYTLPMGVAAGAGGPCVLCHYCDGFACPLHAKCDADVRCVRPALESSSIRLQTNAYAERLITDRSGRKVIGVDVRINGEHQRATASKFVVCAGAGNTAALFLRSRTGSHPNGLGNSSDQVGRNYTQQRESIVMGIDPRRANPVGFQKTLGINDFYLRPDGNHPRLGSIQITGKILYRHVKGEAAWIPTAIAKHVATHSVDFWLMTEEASLPQNRVVLGHGGTIRLEWVPTNVRRHRKLIRATAKMLRRAGYPVVVWRYGGLHNNAEQSGTMRMGSDPMSSVLDPLCRLHDLENVYAVDASFAPSLGMGPGGPTLTIAAMALRVAAESDLVRA